MKIQRIICLMLFFVSVMQISLAAVMPVSNLMQSNATVVFQELSQEPSHEQSSMNAVQEEHCSEMMDSDNMSMNDMTQCISECECCLDMCVTSAVILDYQAILLRTPLLHINISSPVSHPITISTSLYRPPINA